MTRALATRTGITFLSVALKAQQQVLGPHHQAGLEDTAPAARRTLQPALSPRPAAMHAPSGVVRS